MDQAELEWKKLRPECDMLLARKIEGISEIFIDDICWRSTVFVI